MYRLLIFSISMNLTPNYSPESARNFVACPGNKALVNQRKDTAWLEPLRGSIPQRALLG